MRTPRETHRAEDHHGANAVSHTRQRPRPGLRTSRLVVPACAESSHLNGDRLSRPDTVADASACSHFAALLAFTGLVASAAGLPRFKPEIIAGHTMNLPLGWQRQQDEASLILTEDPDDEDSPALALFAIRIDRALTGAGPPRCGSGAAEPAGSGA